MTSVPQELIGLSNAECPKPESWETECHLQGVAAQPFQLLAALLGTGCCVKQFRLTPEQVLVPR